MALSADQVYLLNTLSYLSKAGVYDASAGMSVEEFVRTISNSPSLRNQLADRYQSADQIKSICDQILKDETLCDMQIEHSSRTEGGADCLVITTPDGAGEKQAVIVFEGTTGGVEWRDDFEGGTVTNEADGVSTREQQKCMDWYQSDEIQSILNDCDKITVSGHSKGGNKAKYLTLLDDSIDECISFDGQGFSDEFVDEYSSEIMRNQHKITNYNNSDDYVNILLNDVGEVHYVEGTDVGLDVDINHSLFTLYDSIPMEDHYKKQNELLAEADQFLNSFLRSLSQEEKDIFLKIAGELTADFLGGDHQMNWDDAKDYYDMLMKKGGKEVLGKLLDYLVAYASYELAERIIGMLRDAFPFLSPWLNGLLEKVKDKGGMPDGADIRLGNAADRIVTDTDVLRSLANQMRTLCSELNSCSGAISRCASEVDDAKISVRISLSIVFAAAGLAANLMNSLIEGVLRKLSQNAKALSGEAEALARSIRELAELAENTERQNIALLPDGGHRASPYS